MSKKIIPGVMHLVPKSHVVKALQFTGKNFDDVCNFVPQQFRAFISSFEKELLMVQTCGGCASVEPGMYIIFGRIGSAIGYHVLTEFEVENNFNAHVEESASSTPSDPLSLVKPIAEASTKAE